MPSLQPIGPDFETLKKRFSAGSIPTQQDFYDLIDMMWAGFRAVGMVGDGSGLLTNEKGQLRVALGNGLHPVGNNVAVNPGEGIGFSGDGKLTLKLKDNSGLQIGEDGLKLKTGDGMTAEDKGLSLMYGEGIDVVDGKLEVKVGTGLEIDDDNKIQVMSMLIGVEILPTLVENLTPEERADIFQKLSEHSREIEAEAKYNRLGSELVSTKAFLYRAVSILEQAQPSSQDLRAVAANLKGFANKLYTELLPG